LKLDLASHIMPRPGEGERRETCVLCGQPIPIGLPRSAVCEDCLQIIETNTGNTYFHLYRNHSQPWLVKSGGIVLGPLSSAQVEEKIRHKEIGLFDLVQRPYGRWIYAREEETFRAVVEEVRSHPSAHEDTVALTSTEITEAMDGTEFDGDTLASARTVQALKDGADQAPMESYGAESRPGSAFRNFMLFAFVLVLAAVVVSVVSFRRGLSGDGEKNLEDAVNAYAAGDYNAARTSFRKANAARELDTENMLSYLSVLIGQDLLAEAAPLLDKLESRNLDSGQKTRLYVLRGLRAMGSADLDGAEEFFKKALEENRSDEYAVFNMASVQLLKNEPDRALDTLETVENPTTDARLWNFLLAEAAATKAKNKDNGEGLGKIVEKIGSSLPAAFAPQAYSTETNLLLAYLHNKLGNGPAVGAIVENILKAEPEVTDSSVENLWMFHKKISWQNLEVYCMSLKNALKESGMGNSLWAYCKARAGDTAKAKELSQDLYMKKESDSTARALLAYSQLKIGKDDEAASLLKTQNLQSPFEHWILAHACASLKNAECLDREVGKLLEVTPASPFALAEKIKTVADKRDRAGFDKWIEIARRKAWYYQPIRQLELANRSL
jgi:thioredoxin-like negative regulator of GroEL